MAAPHAGERLKSQRATASPAISTRPEVAFTSRKLIATRRPIWVDPKLELIPVPMADITRAKVFYVEQVGFRLDHDVRPSAMVRMVRLTPPGAACTWWWPAWPTLAPHWPAGAWPWAKYRIWAASDTPVSETRPAIPGPCRKLPAGRSADSSARLVVRGGFGFMYSRPARPALRGNWQREAERAAAAQLAFYPQPAALRGDELASDA